MHVPSPPDTLSTGVDPIPTPDTKRDAEMLLIMLDAGLYSRIQPTGAPDDGVPEDGAGGAIALDRGAGE